MKASDTKLQRRTFMTAAACVPALAVAALVARKPAAPPLPVAEVAPEPVPDTASRSGYHETEHIRHYYATAAF